MRVALSGLLLLLGSNVASAEVWVTREGRCGEWRARWDVQQQPDGVWIGRINARQTGGRCVERTDRQAEFDVRAVLQGDSLFALRRDQQGEFCSYYAQGRERPIRGLQLCEGRSEPSIFVLRFPQGRPDQTEDDDWVEDQRNFDRREAPPAFGPRR
jgi:hypothetical protein